MILKSYENVDLENLENTLFTFTDSKAAQSILTKGSRSPKLQEMDMKYCLKLINLTCISINWMYRDEAEMQMADWGSSGSCKCSVGSDNLIF